MATIPMETTINNLRRLDEANYEHVSFIISQLANDSSNRDATEEEVMASFARINEEYSDTFRALAQ